MLDFQGLDTLGISFFKNSNKSENLFFLYVNPLVSVTDGIDG